MVNLRDMGERYGREWEFIPHGTMTSWISGEYLENITGYTPFVAKIDSDLWLPVLFARGAIASRLPTEAISAGKTWFYYWKSNVAMENEQFIMDFLFETSIREFSIAMFDSRKVHPGQLTVCSGKSPSCKSSTSVKCSIAMLNCQRAVL